MPPGGDHWGPPLSDSSFFLWHCFFFFPPIVNDLVKCNNRFEWIEVFAVFPFLVQLRIFPKMPSLSCPPLYTHILPPRGSSLQWSMNENFSPWGRF